jgi:ParB-like chromosome segregation protein Spo0J
MNIDLIRVEDRHRADLGDLSDLAASIASKGLLHPVVVTQGGRLIAGQRRLEACRSLGWSDVPVTFTSDREDAISLLEMERDENTCRKDMKPSERVALGRALEALEAPKAAQALANGQSAGGRARHGLLSVPPNEEQKKPYDTREVVAPAVGMSTATYSRAKQLVQAAEAGDEDAAAGVAAMDRTNKVTPAYERWKGRKVNDPDKAGPARAAPESRTERAEQIRSMAEQAYSTRQIAATMGLHEGTVKNICRDFDIDVSADKIFAKTRRLDSNRIATNTVTALEGLVTSVDLIDYNTLDRAEAQHWATSLTDSLRALDKFAKQIKEMT